MKQIIFAFFAILALCLTACGAGASPSDGNPNTNIVPIPKPEPPAIIITVPYTLQELAVRCGTVELASTDYVPSRMPQDCADFIRHGLRAKRLAEFAAAGIVVEQVMAEIGNGNYNIINAGQDGISSAIHMMVNGVRVLMIFGGVGNPTIFPTPNAKWGETLADAINKWFTGENARFSQPLTVTNEISETMKALARCVSDQLKNRLVPEPASQPVPVPVPQATATVEFTAQMTVVENSFITSDPYLASLSSDEVEVLIFIGVVAIVGAVIITCATTACTTTGPATLALVALVP